MAVCVPLQGCTLWTAAVVEATWLLAISEKVTLRSPAHWSGHLGQWSLPTGLVDTPDVYPTASSLVDFFLVYLGGDNTFIQLLFSGT